MQVCTTDVAKRALPQRFSVYRPLAFQASSDSSFMTGGEVFVDEGLAQV
jgi:hypothetical protein